MVTLNQIVETSVSRAKKWHKGDLSTWSLMEWAGAMCGEAGESVNAAKKAKREDQQLLNINTENRSETSVDALLLKVAWEAADTLLYSVLVMHQAGITDVEALVRAVFNKKSEEYGFSERI